MNRDIAFKVGAKIHSMTLACCTTEHIGGSAPALLVKREPDLETEIIRLDKRIRLDGHNGTFSDVFAKVIDVKSTGKNIIVSLGFDSITAPPSPSMGEMVFDHFLVKEDNGEIVVYAKEDAHSLLPKDYFNVIIEYADEGISGAKGFKVTDRISESVLDAGSDAIQWIIQDKDCNIKVGEPMKDMLHYYLPKKEQNPEAYDQCESADSHLKDGCIYVEEKSTPFSLNELLAKPSDTGRIRALTRRDDSKKDLLLVPNFKTLFLTGESFGNIDPISIYLKIVMLCMHTMCASCCNVEKDQRPLALRVYLQTPNVLTQKQLTILLERFNSLVNHPDFLSQYGLDCIEIQSISESDCDLFHFVAASKVNYNGRFMVINVGRSTRDWSIAEIKNRQITIESRGGDMKAGNQDGFGCALELVTAIALYGEDRVKQLKKMMTAEPYLLNKFYEIVEKMKREYKSSASVMPLNFTDDPSKLTVEKTLEMIETIGTINDTYGIISQMIDRNTIGLAEMLKANHIDYLLLAGRSCLFPPLYEKIEKIAKALGIKVFMDKDPYRLKSASMYGALTGYQKEYNLVGFPIVKNRQNYSEPINEVVMKIMKHLFGEENVQTTGRVLSQNYQSNVPKVVYDEKQLKSGGVLIPYSDDLVIEINGIEYRQSREIIKAPKGTQIDCYVKLTPDGDFYLRYKNKQSILEPVVLAKGNEDLLETLFPWSLKLIPTLSLENLPEARIKR